MSESAGKVKSKIQSTRQWLNRAEEHFGRDAAVRGELDLMLAEAELRATRESLQHEPCRRRIGWFHQAAAVTLAATIAAAGLGGAWLWWHDPANVAKELRAASDVRPQSAAPVQEAVATVVARPADTPAVVETTNPGQEVNHSDRPVNRDSTVSPDEMRRLVQAAGQSLRGRTKP